MKRKIVTAAIIAMALMLLFVGSALAETIDSGNLGPEGSETSITWVLDNEGTLTVSGTGEMRSFSNDSEETNPLYPLRESVKKIVIEEGVTGIGDYVFNGFTELTSVTIPEGVLRIGDYAFEECTLLDNVKLPESLETLGDAFIECNSLTEIVIPANVEYIEACAFDQCENLESLKILGANTKTGLGSMIDGCTKLTSAGPIGSGCCVEFAWTDSIPNYFFMNGSIQKLTLPETITTIGKFAFQYCPLGSVTIPESVTSIGSAAFGSCKLKSVKISTSFPNAVSDVSEYVFFNNPGMTVYLDGTQKDWKTEWDAYFAEDVTVSYRSGWETDEEGNTYYNVNYKHVKGWKKIGKYYYWFDTTTGFMFRSSTDSPAYEYIEEKGKGGFYFFDNKGHMLSNGFVKDEQGRVYLLSKSGANVHYNGWKKVSGKWYWFMDGDTDLPCYVKSNENLYDGTYYYWLDSDGVMAANKWVTVDGRRSYYNQYGHLIKGWLKRDGEWYYLDENSDLLKNTWLKEGTKWYRFDSDGVMAADEWVKVGSKKYYFDRYGAMADGWVKIDGKWHYIEDGYKEKKSCWLKDDGDWYYLDENGEMVTNKVIDGWKLNKYGVGKKVK